MILGSAAGNVYLDVKDMITVSLTSMILIVVGYDLSFKAKLIKPCILTIFLRVLVQAVALIPTVIFISKIFPGDMPMVVAAVCYMTSPATFSMQSFLKTEEGSEYAATTNSLYCVVSIMVYVVLAFIMK